MLTDFYEITMANGYLECGMEDRIAYFDMYFRQAPDGAGFAIMAGVKQLIDYLSSLEFSKEDIEFLRSKNMFCEKFLDYLSDLNLNAMSGPYRRELLFFQITYSDGKGAYYTGAVC